MRKAVGVVLLISGLAAIYLTFFTEPIAHGHVLPKNETMATIYSVVICAWLFSSALTKLSMIFGKKIAVLNIVSCLMLMLAYFLAILTSGIEPTNTVSAILTPLQNAAGTFLFIGWFWIDLADFLFSVHSV